jgi:hypothetical protein
MTIQSPRQTSRLREGRCMQRESWGGGGAHREWCGVGERGDGWASILWSLEGVLSSFLPFSLGPAGDCPCKDEAPPAIPWKHGLALARRRLERSRPRNPANPCGGAAKVFIIVNGPAPTKVRPGGGGGCRFQAVCGQHDSAPCSPVHLSSHFSSAELKSP